MSDIEIHREVVLSDILRPSFHKSWEVPKRLIETHVQTLTTLSGKTPYAHQKYNLEWFLHQIYYNRCGGMLADDTSAGKTFSMILILSFLLQFPLFTPLYRQEKWLPLETALQRGDDDLEFAHPYDRPSPTCVTPKILVVVRVKNIHDPWWISFRDNLYVTPEDLAKNVSIFRGKKDESMWSSDAFANQACVVLMSYESLLAQYKRYAKRAKLTHAFLHCISSSFAMTSAEFDSHDKEVDDVGVLKRCVGMWRGMPDEKKEMWRSRVTRHQRNISMDEKAAITKSRYQKKTVSVQKENGKEEKQKEDEDEGEEGNESAIEENDEDMDIDESEDDVALYLSAHLLYWTVCDFYWESMIMDEAHRIMNAENNSLKLGKSVYNMTEYHTGTALLMSATPMNNRESEIVSYARACGPHEMWASRVLWNKIFAMQDKDRRMQVIEQIRDLFMIRTNRDESFLKLPPCQNFTLLCRQTPTQLSLTQAMINENWSELTADSSSADVILEGSKEKKPKDTNKHLIFTLIQKWKDISASPHLLTCMLGDPSSFPTSDEFEKLSSKVTALYSAVSRFVVQEKRQCIIYCHLITMIEMVHRWIQDRFPELRSKPLHSKSGTSESHQALIQTFTAAESKLNIIITTEKSLGEGISQLTNVSAMFFVDLNWNPNVRKQAVDRMKREGQQRDMVVVNIVNDGYVIDCFILFIQRSKIRDIHPVGKQDTDIRQ